MHQHTISCGPHITNVSFIAAAAWQVDRGLLGWASCTIADILRLRGLAVRRTRDGRIVLSFPCSHTLSGRRQFPVLPFDDAARRQIEKAVFAAVGMEAMP